MTSHSLQIRDLSKIFETERGPVIAVDSVNMEIHGDEFFTMLGPSGCGKTTTLRMVAGLETVTSGKIEFDGQDFTKFSTFQRSIGMVFQSYALFPH
ncbi:MAG: ATP-binding cassette domain-containing protein, partial [Rhodospirillales bacterium]|nr:ATP-binding cassette domain-containing protein [Rhodospirillales bacterium]